MYDQAFKTGLWRQGFAAAIGMIGAAVMMAFVAMLSTSSGPRAEADGAAGDPPRPGPGAPARAGSSGIAR